MELNHLAHLTNEEYKCMLGFRNQLLETSYNNQIFDTPVSIDYRTKGIVNLIQDQGNCGSCWAFSAIQAQESQWARIHGILYKLSEQNLLDCVTSCFGCSGGLPESGLQYVIQKQNGRFMLESDYHYISAQTSCHFRSDKTYSYISSIISIATGSETELASQIANFGVASIAIDSASVDFQLYSSGIFDDKSCSNIDLNHAVGCVGFGVDHNIPFWIVRNSWGVKWGEAGYIRMIRNANNQCGIATLAIIPIDY